jgi:glycosyltransferase involved in cell wall biosynthesis
MRILISAFSCAPGIGSEPEVGLQAVLIAASQHDVWVITEQENIDPLVEFFEDHPARGRIHLVGLEVGGIRELVKDRVGLLTFHWYYAAWQRRMAEVAVSLDAEIDFEVVHHVTFSSYWSRAGVAKVNKPMIWGPVGGATTAPLSMFPAMGFIGGLSDLVRTISRPIVASINGAQQCANRAAVVLAQNPETAKLFPHAALVRILPNGLVAARSLDGQGPKPPRTNLAPQILVSGRLIGLKGTSLAVRAMTHIRNTEATLEIFGDGTQRRRLQRLVKRLRLEARVHFHGNVPRHELLAKLESASALIHPALHDESPLTVVEALALGIPVVCFDEGGPRVVASYWPNVPKRLVHASTPAATVRHLASALDEVIGQRGEFDSEPAESFADGLLSAYDHAISHHRL